MGGGGGNLGTLLGKLDPGEPFSDTADREIWWGYVRGRVGVDPGDLETLERLETL